MELTLYKPNDHHLKEVVFNQPAGLGDILFIEPIYRHYYNLGYKVIAPVNDDCIWVQHYIPYVEFKKRSRFSYSYETVQQPSDGRLHLPTRFSHPLLRGYDLHYGDDRANWMRDKYLFLGLDEELWRTMSFQRNKLREEILLKKLNIQGPFNFVNEYFGGSFEKVPIKTGNDLPNVYLKKLEGITLLDWMAVIELAENIYTVETSILWVIESMQTQAKEYHLYPRTPFLPNVDYIKSYMKKNWKFYDESEL